MKYEVTIENTKSGKAKKVTVEAADKFEAMAKVETMRWGQSSAKTISFELPPGADVHNVPLEYLRMKDPELDKQALKAAYEAELPIPEQVVVTEKPGTRYLRIK
jgi:hypothetical protein